MRYTLRPEWRPVVFYQLTDDYVDMNEGKAEGLPFVAVMQIEGQMKELHEEEKK